MLEFLALAAKTSSKRIDESLQLRAVSAPAPATVTFLVPFNSRSLIKVLHLKHRFVKILSFPVTTFSLYCDLLSATYLTCFLGLYCFPFVHFLNSRHGRPKYSEYSRCACCAVSGRNSCSTRTTTTSTRSRVHSSSIRYSTRICSSIWSPATH